jgi:threonine dehydrogenase-like Zn-dependent dehydrogenase
VKVGDRVLVSCISACGSCRFCREGRYGQCRGGAGWILGNEINGTQADLAASRLEAAKQFGADVVINNAELWRSRQRALRAAGSGPSHRPDGTFASIGRTPFGRRLVERASKVPMA